MILKYWPDHFVLEAVIVYCFNSCGKLLVLQKTWQDMLYPGMCGTVAGKIKPGENKFAAGKREVGEETGMDVDEETIISLEKSFPTQHGIHATGEPIIFLAHMLLCMQVFENITLSTEHQKYYWIQTSDLHKFNCIPDAIENFEECLPIIRERIPIKV